ncbi:hypothetical protein BOX08_gp63 [Pseudoalteromonas phage BS5]|uniref:hypothetical protein n=1 Tax=Pseudoalteromonas phage BS5 TaxID=1874539 RepID=UPI000819801B|nr:hypothetical protein BOX08_gp63 [Pseudoalteromonas phage BS5]ANY29628.1 hypothetical protein [Pseudoalteromonas phage BS5]
MSKLTGGVLDYEGYAKLFGTKPFMAYADGGSSTLKVISVNIDSKVVVHYKLDENNNPAFDGENLIEESLKPKSFKAYAGDELIIEW